MCENKALITHSPTVSFLLTWCKGWSLSRIKTVVFEGLGKSFLLESFQKSQWLWDTVAGFCLQKSSWLSSARLTSPVWSHHLTHTHTHKWCPVWWPRRSQHKVKAGDKSKKPQMSKITLLVLWPWFIISECYFGVGRLLDIYCKL